MTLISCNTKHTQRYLSFLFTIFTIPGWILLLFSSFRIFYFLDTSVEHQNFAHETLQQLILIVPLYELGDRGNEFMLDILEHRHCCVQLWNNIFHF